jgi:galactokinase
MNPFEHQVVTTLAPLDFFAADKPVWVARAPGRLDVLGGNVDYTGGLVLQSLLREAVWVAVQLRTDDVIRVLNPGAGCLGWATFVEFSLSSVKDIASVRSLCSELANACWAMYVLGSVYMLKSGLCRDSAAGIDVFISSDLPPNKGVSSSAALEVAVLKALSSAWGSSLDGVALATAAQWVENAVVGAACGIMDQAAIVLGQEDCLLPLLCQPCLPAPAVRWPAGVGVWGIDSMAARSTTGAAYETARAAAFIGYKQICRYEGIEVVEDEVSGIPRFTDSRWHGYLSNLSVSEFRSRYERLLPESLTGSEFLARGEEHADPFTTVDPMTEYPVRAAVRYAAEQNLRGQIVKTLLESTSASGSDSLPWLIGEIFLQSHDAYSDCGLGSDACDELVSRALKAGFWGAKMTGGGAGGVVAILGRSNAESRHAIQKLAQEYGAGRGAVPHIFEGTSGGVDAFGIRSVRFSGARGASR